MKYHNFIAALVLFVFVSCSNETPLQDEQATLSPEGHSLSKATQFGFVLKVPIDFTDFLPCALGGAGEEVEVSGKGLLRIQSVIDAAGGIHFTFHFNDAGVSGVGLTSGDKYQATGAANTHFNNLSPGVFTCNSALNFGIVGRQANGLLLAKTHFTVNANGEVTASVESFSFICQEDLPPDTQICALPE